MTPDHVAPAEMPFVAGVRHRTVAITGERGPVGLHLAEAGAGEPVLLLHGWPQHWYCWRRLVPALSQRHRLLMPDLRGFGWSDTPGYGYDPHSFAADTPALLDACGLERVSIVGHDWGGFTAFLMAVAHPERVSRLVVLNAPPLWIPLTFRIIASLWRTWYVALLASPFGPRVLGSRWFVPWFLGLGGCRRLFTADEAETYARRLRQPARARASSQLYRAYLRTAGDMFLRRRYRHDQLEARCLLLFGTDDIYVPLSYIAGYERNAPHLAVELMPGCGHFVPEEIPGPTAARILDFLR